MSLIFRPQEILGLPSRYTLHSLLGEGGSGRVYQVRDLIRGRDLALKLVTPSESEWLRREFDTLRQIRHENLIQVFDWGALDSGEAYYTMELIEGKDWGARMGSAQQPDEVRRTLTGLLRGLAHLHCHGEIHGDLKPGNILLDRDGAVKVTDVGMGASGAGSARLSGTPGYTAPEIWEGAKAGIRSDLYSVGVMAYEALTGVHPFGGRTVREVVSGQLEGWAPSPGAHSVDVPADLERVVMRAVERNPELRQGSADEFMEGMGVEDRIGEILGGRFVGREDELRRVLGLLQSDRPGTPTVLYVDGPQGIGKRVFAEEIAQRAIASGARVIHSDLDQVTPRQADVPGYALEEAGLAAGGASSYLSLAAEALWEEAAQLPTLLIDRLPADTHPGRFDRLRSIARYLWALSSDTGRPAGFVLVVPRGENAIPPAEFETSIQLQPYSIEELKLHIEGTLGTVELEEELVRKLQAITGGSPGAVESLLFHLARQKLLDRRDGIWRFREAEQIQSLELPSIADRWAASWQVLTDAGRVALLALALVPRCLTVSQLSAVIAGGDLISTLTALRLRGWVRGVADRWELASEEIRRAVLSQASAATVSEIRERLLSNTGAPLDREDRASLRLKSESSQECLAEGLWAAEQSAARGDYRETLRRLDDCARIGAALSDHSSLRNALLMRGFALHHLGQDDEALAAVERDPYWNESTAPTLMIRREHLLGLVYRTQGDYKLARLHFLNAIQQAELHLDTAGMLRNHAELAELDWRHGDETARNEAMARVRVVLKSDAAKVATVDERAALAYQLGAALILAGERQEAERVLLSALALGPGDFWRMRIATALATAAYYLGRSESALDWISEAWQCAERGGFDAYKARILSNRGAIYYGRGRFRDAVDAHSLSAQWGRRNGNSYEFLAACAGASVNLTLIAQYELAREKAREAQEAALRVRSEQDFTKAKELEALCVFHIGDYQTCSRLVQEAEQVIQRVGFHNVKPRLDWLKARVCIEEGREVEAEDLLLLARDVLARTQDWEDLPGVEVELALLRARREETVVHLTQIKKIATQAEATDAVIVQLRGGLAIGKILTACDLDDREGEGLVARSLARAEQAGAAEMVWRLSGCLGEFAERRGDAREAQARYGRTLRSLREVADRLSPMNRRYYLNTSHAVSALSKLAPIYRPS